MSSLLVRAPAAETEDSPDDQQTEQDAQDLAVAVAAAFLLTDDEVATLGEAILTARVASWQATYSAAAKTAGATLPDSGPTLSAAEERRQQRESDAAAASIAATYARDLASQAAQFTQDWLTAHDGSLDGAESALRAHLTSYSETRADAKASQVAQYETGVGGQDGLLAAHDDLTSGDLTDASGDPFTSLTGILYVAILPEDSSSDFCADYAGNVYSFDDAPALDFPAHVNCRHYCVFVTAADFGDGEAPM